MATSLFGTLKDPNGNGLNGSLSLALSRQGALRGGGCGGPAEILPNIPFVIQVIAGVMQGSPSVYGNDCMLPQGTYYIAIVRDRGGNILLQDNWVITGSSVDVGTIVSAVVNGTTDTLGAPGVVFTVPTSSQTVTQPVGTQLSVNIFNVSSSFTAPNGATCTATGCTGFTVGNLMTTDTNQNVTGTKVFYADVGFAGASVGLTAAPAVNGLFGGAVLSPIFKSFLGTVAAQTDYFTWALPARHQFSLYNSSGNESLRVDQTNTLTPTPPAQPGTPYSAYWEFYGHVVPQASSQFDLGTSSLPWRSGYFAGGIVANGGIATASGSNSNIFIGTGGNFYFKSYAGGDAVCTSVADGWTGIRTDTSPPQFQVCVAGNLLKLPIQP
jgi:hypothetical protein